MSIFEPSHLDVHVRSDTGVLLRRLKSALLLGRPHPALMRLLASRDFGAREGQRQQTIMADLSIYDPAVVGSHRRDAVQQFKRDDRSPPPR